jgi:hypothetical protein
MDSMTMGITARRWQSQNDELEEEQATTSIAALGKKRRSIPYPDPVLVHASLILRTTVLFLND